ncbi:hypothetical protein Hypma_010639 [Hypsizygus marmoreus]|uniref:Uncharacterized protein n=1 Tax=Hypsizygus marmoreus TaxID=39966 RepID=A0A369JJ00_HYPMA|nr:hypothetical protein Hypma_010639 [Hypsizygus marmoreus]
MSVSCASSPTLTSTQEFTSHITSTSTSTSLTTGTPTTVTSITLTCDATPPPGVTSTCLPTLTTIITTIPGEVETMQVPITLTTELTSTSTTTLWGSQCTTFSHSNPPSPTPEPPPSTSTTISISTPPPEVITTESTSTQPNGSVIIQTVTSISTQSGIPVPTNVQTSEDRGTNVGPIVGGAVAGFFGLIGVVALIWFLIRRRRRWDDIFDKEDEDIGGVAASARRHNRFSLDVDPEPKPYQYGLVGHATAPHSASPPHSPPLLPTAGSDLRSGPRSSLSPLNVPMTASTSIPSATTMSSRPSTAGSMQPLRPASQHGAYVPSVPQQPQPTGYGGMSPSSGHSHSHSSVSFTQPAVALASWNASPGPGYNEGTAINFMGRPISSAGSDDPLHHRSGSPSSIQEQQPVRRLQVANATPLSPASATVAFDDAFSSSLAAAASAEPQATATAVPQRDGKGRLRTSTGKAPLVHLDGGRVQEELNASSSSAAGSSSSAGGPSPPEYVA